MARGVKVHDPNDPKVGVVGGGAYAPAPHAPSPAAGHPYNPYCPVSWLPALGRSEHLLTVITAFGMKPHKASLTQCEYRVIFRICFAC